MSWTDVPVSRRVSNEKHLDLKIRVNKRVTPEGDHVNLESLYCTFPSYHLSGAGLALNQSYITTWSVGHRPKGFRYSIFSRHSSGLVVDSAMMMLPNRRYEFSIHFLNSAWYSSFPPESMYTLWIGSCFALVELYVHTLGWRLQNWTASQRRKTHFVALSAANQPAAVPVLTWAQ